MFELSDRSRTVDVDRRKEPVEVLVVPRHGLAVDVPPRGVVRLRGDPAAYLLDGRRREDDLPVEEVQPLGNVTLGQGRAGEAGRDDLHGLVEAAAGLGEQRAPDTGALVPGGDADGDGDTLAYTVVSSTTDVTASISDTTLTLDPAANFLGDATITVTDNGTNPANLFASETITISVSEGVLKRARIRALQDNTSVNAVLKQVHGCCVSKNMRGNSFIFKRRTALNSG